MTGLTYTEPLLLCFFLMSFAGLFRLWKRCGPRRPRFLAAALTGLFLICWPPVDWLLARPLEGRYQRTFDQRSSADAIVVLASNIEPARQHFPVALPDISTYARCRYAAALYNSWRPLPVVVSGGNSSSREPSFAAAMADMLVAEGVPRDAIVLEGKSSNTCENVRFTAELLRPRGIRQIVLVLEADAMLRAELVFRKEGIAVIPAPFRQRSVSATLEDLLPSWKAVRRNEITLHEVLGLAWYKVQGCI